MSHRTNLAARFKTSFFGEAKTWVPKAGLLNKSATPKTGMAFSTLTVEMTKTPTVLMAEWRVGLDDEARHRLRQCRRRSPGCHLAV